MSTEFFNDQWRIPSNENQNKISNYSMDFGGTNQSINLGSDFPYPSVSTDPWSISFWIKPNSATSNGFIFSTYDVSNIRGFYVYLRSGGTNNDPLHVSSIMRAGTTGYSAVATSDPIAVGEWQHIVVAFDGVFNAALRGITIYVNGSPVSIYQFGSVATNGSLITSVNKYIGQREDNSGYLTNCELDQVTFFDYELSATQVASLGLDGYAFNFPTRAHPAAQTIILNKQAQVFNNATNFSFSGWFKMDNNEYQNIFDLKDGSNYRFNINYYSPAQGLRCNFNTSGGGGYASLNNAISSGKIALGEWFHYAGVLDGSGTTNSDRVKLYINGQPVSLFYGGTQATSLGAIGATNKIEIGQSINSTFRGFRGDAGNVQMWDASLSPSEVTTLYNNGKPLYTGTQPQASNMQFWYKLDNSELFNGAEWSIDNSKYPSVYKSSLNFSGNNQYLQVPDSNDFSFGNGATDSPFSVSAWVNPDVVESAGIVAKYVTSGWEWLVYFTDSNKLRLQLQNNNSTGNTINLTTDAAIPINTWTHVSATYNANSESNGIDLYINGSLQSLVTEGGSGTYQAMTNTTAPLQIGTWSGSFRPINGQISNVSIWDAELTQAQVSEIYNNGTPSNLSSHSATSNLISWWELDNTTTGLQDSKGSNNASNIGTTEYIGFVNTLAGESDGMNASSLVASNINGELITNPMITSPKPIAYYQLGDQSVSTGPTSSYLVPNNSLSDYVFNFDGTNDYINAGSASYLNGLSQFSISVWFNLHTAADAKCIISDWNFNTSPFGHFSLRTIDTSGTDYALILYIKKDLSDAGSNAVKTSVIFTENTWYNAVFTYNSGTITCYINGSTVALTTINTIASSLLNQDGILIIGNWTGVSQYWDGQISNTAVFNTQLTSTQVQTIYNNGAPNDISSLSPTAWYKLDAGEIFNSTSTKWSVDNNAYPSVYKSSLNFNGTSDYLDTPQIDLGSTNTISFWINTTTTTQGTIFGDPNGYADYALFSQPTLNRTAFRLGNNDSGYYQIEVSSGLLNDGNWHHHCLTRDGVTINYYIDGILQTNVINNTLNASAGTNTTIENIFAMPNGNFKYGGKLSNVALFNSALISSQVQTLYNNGTPEASISYSPVSWWKLDNTTTGLIDNGSASNNGTNNGATEYAGFVNELAGKSFNMNSANLVTSDLQQTSGYSPYALDFDGIDDYLDCGNDSSLQITGAMTISYWVKGTSTLGASGVGTLDSATTSVGYLLGPTTTNTISFGVALTSSSLLFVPTTQQITTTEWHHIVGVYTPSVSMKIYIDGQLSKTETSNIPSSQYASGSDFRIGYRTCCQIDGQISNVAIWNTDLSSSEINEIYNEGVPSNLNNFSGTAPVSWWQIGSNSSYNSGAWTCLDEIGSNNAVSSGSMTNDDIVDGPGYSASGLGASSIDIKGDAPYSTANGLSENMDVLDRTLDTPIRNTHSIELDGVDDYVFFTPTNFVSNNQVSYSFWVKPDTYVDTIGYFISGGSNLNGGIGYSQGYTGGSYLPGRVLFYTGSSAAYTNTYLTENVWNHLVVTFGTNMKIYKNGVLEGTYGASYNAYRHTFRYMGRSWGGNNVNGKMDEVSIFSSELSASQVLSVWNNGTPSNILPLNPALWYRFESTTDNNGIIEVSDDSGNGKTGQLKNGASLSTVVP